MDRFPVVVAACLLSFALAGCSGGPKFVPVSGVVKVNGQPYPHAVVTFQPIGTSENPNPGRGSSANTDEQGRFQLVCDGTIDGAVVGKHRVRIATRTDVVLGTAESRGGSSDETRPAAQKAADRIPVDWVGDGHEFEVPPGGTDQANFDITTTPAP
jgi:hypothetical protein